MAQVHEFPLRRELTSIIVVVVIILVTVLGGRSDVLTTTTTLGLIIVIALLMLLRVMLQLLGLFLGLAFQLTLLSIGSFLIV